MHTITGIGKCLLWTVAVVLLPGCHTPDAEGGEAGDSGRVNVRTTTITVRSLEQRETLPAQVVYLSKSEITAPGTGYITSVRVQVGDRVSKGKLLFGLETKEHRILRGDTSLAARDIRSMGTFAVMAPANGYVTTMHHQTGDYVQEGVVLCEFTRDDESFFKVFAPITLGRKLTPGTPATILLPGREAIPGTVKEVLSQVDAASQSLQIMVAPKINEHFPENMNAQVSFTTGYEEAAQIIPGKALLSNERLEEFWVMQLINDSVAVKVPVIPGISRNDSVQIVQPQFQPGTLLLTEGSYGLADTAKVEVRP